jgi:2-isopropylmalate synthase
MTVRGTGNGPIDAFVHSLRQDTGVDVKLVDYSEHALGHGADAEAVAYVRLQTSAGTSAFGVGRHQDIVTASLRAVASGLNRLVASMDRAEERPGPAATLSAP